MRTWLAVCAIAIVLGTSARDARADWYSDARDIIEKVIETEISTTVIPNAAARVPALCAFFPSSLAAIQAQRYTGLQTVMRKEVADAVGYEVLTYLRRTSPDAGAGTTPEARARARGLATQDDARDLSSKLRASGGARAAA